MADENRFDGLGDQLPEDDESRDEPEDDGTDDRLENLSLDAEEELQEETDDQAEDAVGTVERSPKEIPAFAFDDAKQDALYPREETWQDYEDALDFEVRRDLREDDYQDVEKRELHDATLRVAIENPELVAEAVRRQRGGE